MASHMTHDVTDDNEFMNGAPSLPLLSLTSLTLEDIGLFPPTLPAQLRTLVIRNCASLVRICTLPSTLISFRMENCPHIDLGRFIAAEGLVEFAAVGYPPQFGVMELPSSIERVELDTYAMGCMRHLSKLTSLKSIGLFTPSLSAIPRGVHTLHVGTHHKMAEGFKGLDFGDFESLIDLTVFGRSIRVLPPNVERLTVLSGDTIRDSVYPRSLCDVTFVELWETPELVEDEGHMPRLISIWCME